jgi:hypothetical protein
VSNTNNTDITIPAAFYEIAVSLNHVVPVEQEIRSIGKGRQYVIDRNDAKLASFVRFADICLTESDSKIAAAARSTLLALRKQGIRFELRNELKVGAAKPVTRKVAAHATGRDYNRELIVTITPRGDLILRPSGRRQAELVALSDVYAWAQRNRCLKIARDKAADRAAKRKAKRSSR